MLKVLTYNIMYNDISLLERFKYIMEVLVPKYNPDIILFQEVIFESIKLIKNILSTHGYNYYTDDDYDQIRLYGELIVSKYPIKNSEFQFYRGTLMGRGINIAEIEYKNENLLLLTDPFREPS